MLGKNSFRVSLALSVRQKYWLYMLAFLWLLTSFSVYSFFYLIREVIRLMTAHHGDRVFLVLTDQEHYFYNFCFAAFAGVWSFGFLASLWLSNPFLRRQHFRFQKSAMIFDQVYLSHFSLYIFAKLALAMGMFYIGNAVFLFLDLFEYKLLFIALPLVIFVQQWATINKVFKIKGMKWMGITFLAMVLTSFLFSRINLMDYKTINQNVLARSVSYHYRVLPPVASEVTTPNRRSYYGAVEIYLGFSRSKPDSIPLIIIKDGAVRSAEVSEVQEYIRKQRELINEYEPLNVILSIDRNVKLKYVKHLFRSIAEGQMDVMLEMQTSDKERISSGRKMIPKRLFRHCDEIISLQIDSIKSGKILNDPFPYPECGLGMPFFFEQQNLNIELRNNHLFLDGKPADFPAVYEAVVVHMQNHKEKSVVLLDSDEVSDYAHYIMVYNGIRKACFDLRDELLLRKFGFTYQDVIQNPYLEGHAAGNEMAVAVYPLRIAEFNEREKELLHLISNR